MSDLFEKKNVILVKNYLNKIDPTIKLIKLNTSARTAQDAANSLQKKVGSIVKSLLFKTSNYYYLCLVSGDKRVCLDKFSNILNEKINIANAEEVKKQTGFAIGGVSPFAHLVPPRDIFIDENLSRFDKVYAAAGNHLVVFEISFQKLCLYTEGKIVNIT